MSMTAERGIRLYQEVAGTPGGGSQPRIPTIAWRLGARLVLLMLPSAEPPFVASCVDCL